MIPYPFILKFIWPENHEAHTTFICALYKQLKVIIKFTCCANENDLQIHTVCTELKDEKTEWVSMDEMSWCGMLKYIFILAA